jgi:phenylalanine-4-hydroxylase
MTPTERAIAALPPHLRRFVVAQDHAAYTPRDHAVWRFVLRRLTAHLAGRAHPRYLAGLAAVGIGVEVIPSLDEMNVKLAPAGWSAVGVRGFIPPAVFTELQSRRVLAIAADIRTHEHVEYTPAPDIVHESAGHAPLVADPTYAEYLRRCGEVGFRAIASVEDQAVFEAIRNLSVVKEDPAASADEVRLAEERLAAAGASVREDSEATRASRLYWWTAEYGLVGTLAAPRIYGAGLLSSIGEAVHCLGPEVERVPLTAACADQAFDITRMQPRLFVARDFEQLFEVLDVFVRTLSWTRGGAHGLDVAIRARTVVHLVLSDGREVTGRVAARAPAAGDPALAVLDGPVLLSRGRVAAGRPFAGGAVVALGDAAVPDRGPFELVLASGLRLSGFAAGGGEVLRLSATLRGAPVDVPPWALLAVAPAVPSVAGGPADPAAWDRWFGELSSFAGGEGEARARARKAAALPPRLGALYAEVRASRERGVAERDRLLAIRDAAAAFEGDWLLRTEVDELLAGATTAGCSPPAPAARRRPAARAGARGTRRAGSRSR